MAICSKVPYESKEAALTDSNCIKHQNRKHSKVMKKNRKSFRKLVPYECRYCGSWHLTSQKQRES